MQPAQRFRVHLRVRPVARPRLRPRRHRAVLALAGAVLLLHALLLALWTPAPGPARHADADTARPLQVRRIAPALSPAALPQAQPLKRSAPPDAVKPPDTATADAASQPADPAPIARTAVPEIAEIAPERAAAFAADPPLAAGGEAVPVYATQLPPPLNLRYDMRRSRNPGQVTLQWRPDDAGRYQITWQGPGQAGWASAGTLDSHGIAPDRYTEGRRGREMRAANFQRDPAQGPSRITFSGPSTAYPLQPGAQDRLSWMLQLAAVMAANPALRDAGQQVALFVVGTRGDGDVWTFTVTGSETATLPGGDVPGTLHLQREPRRPYDTGVEVWLDPAQHHLPVRALLRIRATGEATELLLNQASAPASP